MYLLVKTLLVAGLGLASAVSLPARGDTRKRAAYLLSNNPSGDNLLALSISVDDGTLSNPVLTTTGGNGLLGNTANGTGGPDGLFSQGAVVISQDVSIPPLSTSMRTPMTIPYNLTNPNQYLFAVNPGCNTLSMFRISPLDPTHPKLIDQPCDTMGDFPMSVTYSSVLKTACVLNGGAKGGVACFHADHAKGLTPLGGLRPFPISLNQTTPPTGPPMTASDIVFNPSSTALFATIKGDAMALPPKSGYIYAWPVHDGEVATEPVTNRLAALKMDFSIDFLGRDTSALITDPSFGASIVEIAYPSLEITEKHHIVVPNQIAACWGAYAPRFDAAYIIDAGNANITVVDPESGVMKGVIKMSAKGGFDTNIDRTWMYVLTGDSSVVVVDLEGSNPGKVAAQVQKYDLASEGVKGHWEGMAIYPS